MTTPEFLKEHNAQHMIHPMTHPASLKDDNMPKIVSQGEGVYITDVDGNRMVDGVGGLWNVNVGYNRPEIKQAIVDQLDRIHYSSLFGTMTNEPAIELSHKLTQMTAQEGMGRVFFSSGGSDAIETALRLARVYWKSVGQKERFKFISLRGGYHGTHFGGASINGNTVYRRNFEPMLPGCFHVQNPYLYRNPYGVTDHEELGAICAKVLEEEIIFQGPDTVAAFIAEPVQGAGGLIVPPPNYWPLVREVCDKYDVLLVSDEVVTGFGRTGTMFGCRTWGVKPDMMTFAKGINSGYVPLGATMVSEKIEQGLLSNQNSFGAVMHGYTYSGHPVACAAAIPNLEIVENEDIPANSGIRGDYFLHRLTPFIDRFKSVGDIRGKGLMLGIEMVEDKESKTPKAMEFGQQIAAVAQKEGAMVRASGHKIILSPPLVINNDEIDVIVNALDVAFSELDR